jgi:hypothetical protein
MQSPQRRLARDDGVCYVENLVIGSLDRLVLALCFGVHFFCFLCCVDFCDPVLLLAFAGDTFDTAPRFTILLTSEEGGAGERGLLWSVCMYCRAAICTIRYLCKPMKTSELSFLANWIIVASGVSSRVIPHNFDFPISSHTPYSSSPLRSMVHPPHRTDQ